MGSLELTARHIVSGAVRLCYAVMYALFLGFGLAIGSTIYQGITGKEVIGPEDFECQLSHGGDKPWYRQNVSLWWGASFVYGRGHQQRLTRVLLLQLSSQYLCTRSS